jgi:hypothetical protein
MATCILINFHFFSTNFRKNRHRTLPDDFIITEPPPEDPKKLTAVNLQLLKSLWLPDVEILNLKTFETLTVLSKLVSFIIKVCTVNCYHCLSLPPCLIVCLLFVCFFLCFFVSLFHSFILSFFHSFILSFFHSFILSFFHSFILSFPSFPLSLSASQPVGELIHM